MDRISQDELDRFNKGWNQVGECRLWQKYLDKDGYGFFYFKKKKRRAHRVSYYIEHGDIPKGMMIDHICKMRNCVNPHHLRVVTPRQNILENSNSLGAINSKRMHCKYGHVFDRKYTNKKTGKTQRYCSICESAKTCRLQKKWREEANKVLC